MNCPACDLAEKGELTGLYHTGCDECTARHISNGIDLFNARKAGEMTPEYIAILQKVWGDDWESGHERVKAWVKKKGKK
jgi:hypothetical protein